MIIFLWLRPFLEALISIPRVCYIVHMHIMRITQHVAAI